MAPRRFRVVLAVVAGLVLVTLAAALVTVLAWPGWVIATAASWAIGREVTLGAVRIGWGDPLTLVLRDVAVANAPGGSDPRMAHAEEALLSLNLRSLLSGAPEVAELSLRRPTILLEFVGRGIGNWRMGGSGGSGADPRTGFPVLRHAAVTDGRITFRFRSGKSLHLDFDSLDLRTPDDRAPVTLQAAGRYDEMKLTLSGQTGPFAALHDASVPLPARFTIADPDGRAGVTFDGTIADPLALDGFDGKLRIEARQPEVLLGLFGVGPGFWNDHPARLDGQLQRKDDRWALHDAAGELLGAKVSGTLTFDDRYPRPDRLTVAARSPRLDLGALAGRSGTGSIGLHPGPESGLVVAFDLAIGALAFGRLHPTDLEIAGHAGPGETVIDRLQLDYAGAAITGSASAKAAGQSSRIAADARLDADAAALDRALGGDAAQVAGRLTAGAALTASGTTLQKAQATATGAVVVTMRQGRIARALIEKLATDLRTLFRSGEGWVRIQCLLGVVELRQGIGRIAPLVLRTPEAVVDGAGQLKLSPPALDLTVKTDSDTTSFFALDQPLRIHGPPDRLKVGPAVGGGPNLKEGDKGVQNIRTLPPSLKAMAQTNACRRSGAG
jgi:uncharacterized protein involved in outer membrane biogenesis